MTKVASLFGGIGGLDYGFKENGFEITIANESNHVVKEIISFNFPGVWVNESDLDNVCTCGYQHRNPTGVIGCLPKDKQEKALGHFNRIIQATKPIFFVVFADGGIEADEANDELRHISDTLGGNSYDIFVQTMNEACYGSRYDINHLVLVGFREDAGVVDYNFPPSIHKKEEVSILEQTIEGVTAREISQYKNLPDTYFINNLEEDPVVKRAFLDTVAAGLSSALAKSIAETAVNISLPISKLN